MSERKGRPSASSAARYAACPGSFLLEQQAPEVPISADATLGNRVHAWLEGDLIRLTDEEQELADRCAEQENALVMEVYGVPAELIQPVREARLWSGTDRGWSGKADAVYLRNGTALVVDYKTGRGDVEAATGNLQLRALAALVAQQYQASTVWVAIIQPLASRTPSSCVYSPDDLKRAVDETNALMASVLQPGAALKATPEGCKYCRAKSICPEAIRAVETLPAVVPRDGREIAMTGEQVVAFLEAAQVAEGVIDSVRAKAKRMLEEAPGSVPGWVLKPGATREKVVDVQSVFGRFLASGGTQEQFMPAVSLTKSGLKDAVKTATAQKGKALDAALAAMLEGCTEATTAAPSLTKEKA